MPKGKQELTKKELKELFDKIKDLSATEQRVIKVLVDTLTPKK